VTVHHELIGPEHAPVVVLSNSIGTDLHLWDDQVSVLSQRFRVLRYDQRGHGRSSAPPGPYDLKQLGSDVLDLLDSLGLDRVHFAGVSLGGMTGMWLAENAPERLDRLALICTSARLDPPSWRERAALVRANGTGTLVNASLGRWFTAAYSGRPDIADKYGAMLETCDDEGYAGCCEAIATMDILDGLADITAPTLVLAGNDDPATPPSHAERITTAINDARLQVLPEAAHLANVEQADAVNRLLLEHFARSA
jgi:3-oxoadipate enol-lactonase